MKLIKTVGFIAQFSLIGLALAVIYLVLDSGRSREELLDFLHAGPPVETALPASGLVIDSYADAVAASLPSVVTIYTARTVQEKSNPLLDDPVFSQFFGDQLRRRQQDRSETNLGSGVIIGSDGYILTNQHVIDGADEMLISLPDGRGSQAVLIGEDRDTDLAVLQVALGDLPGIPVDATGTPRVGDVVLAIGNPLNVGQTVTMGIISATGRDRIGLNTLVDNFIQTDAAINPGNSGGALINARGELIGINTAILSQSGGAQGIGFAIPIALALDIMSQILEFGEVRRGWIGVEVTELSAQAAMATGQPNVRGALIVGAFIGGPADNAGLRSGDIVVAVDGEPVSGIHELLARITRHGPGERIRVSIYRGSERHELEMETIQRPHFGNG